MTVYQIAARAGVSIATVSRVINNSSAVRASTRAKVLEVIQQLNYLPDGAAQSLGRRSLGVIGLVYRRPDRQAYVEDWDQPVMDKSSLRERGKQSLDYYDMLIRSVEAAACRAGCALLLTGLSDDENLAVLMSAAKRCDGLILLGRVAPDADIARIATHVPVASLSHDLGEIATLSVMIDNRTLMTEVLDHLIDVHGARRIAFIGGPADSDDAVIRAEALLERAKQRGVVVEPLAEWRGDYSLDQAYEVVMRRWPAMRRPLDAVICANDWAAAGALAALTELGVSVPGDVVVTGFDDQEIARLTTPTITTVRQPVDAMASAAASALLAANAGEFTPNGVRLFPGQLVLRRSCGCAATTRRLARS